MNKQADALYPNLVAPEDFRPGDVVKKIFGDLRVTPYLGVVLAVHPTTNTLDIRWPYGIGFENPQDLVRVNPWYNPPSVSLSGDGYYTTGDAEKWNLSEDTENLTKGVSGKSPLYSKAHETRSPVVIDASTCFTTTSNSSVTNFETHDASKNINLKIAQRYARRVFNVLLRGAVSPFNARLSRTDAYRFLYNRFGKIYSEPSIRQVISFLYCTPHNYFEEDFDQVLKQAVKAALNGDKASLKSIFGLVIKNTKGKTGTKVSDLVDAAIEEPHAKALYDFIRQAVSRAKGNLDDLPTPAARFASSIFSSEIVKIADDIESVIDDTYFDYFINFGTSDERANFAYDPKFKDDLSKHFTVRFRGKSSISCSNVSSDLTEQLEGLINQYKGNVEWKGETEKVE